MCRRRGLWEASPASCKSLSRKWASFPLREWIDPPPAHVAGGEHASVFSPDPSFSMRLTFMAIPVG